MPKANILLGLIPLGVVLWWAASTSAPSTPAPSANGGLKPKKPGSAGGSSTIPVQYPTNGSTPAPDASLPLEVVLPSAPQALPGLGSSGSGDGLDWLNSLPGSINLVRKAQGLPRVKKYDVAREKAILDAVRAGMANFQWTQLVLGPVDGTYLTLPVFSRVLRIGATNPVRVDVNYQTAQQIADLLGGALMTPYVVDEIHRQAGLAIDPQLTNWSADGTMAYTDAMGDYSATLDKLVPQDVTSLPDSLVSNEGKDWVITKRFWADNIGQKQYVPGDSKSLWAANYGWLSDKADKTNQVGKKLYQPVGLAHNFGHTDYSQALRLTGLYGVLSGKRNGLVHIGSLLRDPTLSKLLSYEGTLPSWKHPAFQTGGEPPPLEATAPTTTA